MYEDENKIYLVNEWIPKGDLHDELNNREYFDDQEIAKLLV